LRAVSSLALAACAASPPPRVICHNGNCAAGPDTAHDDELETLRASLGLTLRGRPVLDGVEIDTVWSRASGSCIFAHGPDGTGVPAGAAADAIAAYLARATPASWSGERFTVFIELKRTVAADTPHTPDERERHAACAIDLARRLGAATVVIDSAEPLLLEAVARRGGAFQLAADFGSPFDGDTDPFDRFAGVALDVIELHSDWTTDATAEAYRSLGVDLVLWMYSATAETFAAIERVQPDYVLTNEAPLLRRWLER
jgi:hypothetical protein